MNKLAFHSKTKKIFNNLKVSLNILTIVEVRRESRVLEMKQGKGGEKQCRVELCSRSREEK